MAKKETAELEKEMEKEKDVEKEVENLSLHLDDRKPPEERHRAKQCKWLELHNQQTEHFASLVPLVKGMPVRLTENVDRSRSLFRNRRGTIVGWAEHGAEARIEVERRVKEVDPLTVHVDLPVLFLFFWATTFAAYTFSALTVLETTAALSSRPPP